MYTFGKSIHNIKLLLGSSQSAQSAQSSKLSQLLRSSGSVKLSEWDDSLSDLSDRHASCKVVDEEELLEQSQKTISIKRSSIKPVPNMTYTDEENKYFSNLSKNHSRCIYK